MKKFLFVALCLLTLTMSFAFAQVLPTDPTASIDWTVIIANLIQNKEFSAATVGAVVILAIIQGLKSESLGKIFKFIPSQFQLLVIVVLGVVYSILVKSFIVQDETVSGVILAFLSSGGAIVFFNAIKMAFPKFFKVKTEN